VLHGREFPHLPPHLLLVLSKHHFPGCVIMHPRPANNSLSFNLVGCAGSSFEHFFSTMSHNFLLIGVECEFSLFSESVLCSGPFPFHRGSFIPLRSCWLFSSQLPTNEAPHLPSPLCVFSPCFGEFDVQESSPLVFFFSGSFFIFKLVELSPSPHRCQSFACLSSLMWKATVPPPFPVMNHFLGSEFLT